jgi:two-component system nitrogen regulation response regulator NtrX
MVGADGNIAEAARRLQTDRPNLYRRMKRLGIETS